MSKLVSMIKHSIERSTICTKYWYTGQVNQEGVTVFGKDMGTAKNRRED